MKVHQTQGRDLLSLHTVVFTVTTFIQSRDDCLHFPEEKKKNDLTGRGRAANQVLSESKPALLTTVQHCRRRGGGGIGNEPKPPCDNITPARLAAAGGTEKGGPCHRKHPEHQAPSTQARAGEHCLTRGKHRAGRC